MNTGTGLMDIYVHSQINCPEYRDLLKTLYKHSLSVVALDLPKAMYNNDISRNEWMAKTVAAAIARNPDTKMLVVVGNFHVLKEIDWQDLVPNKTGSIREYLSRMVPNLKAFSIGQLIDENPNGCDFTKEFGPIEGSVAIDCDDRFSRWKIGIAADIAIKDTEPCQLFDGLIVY